MFEGLKKKFSNFIGGLSKKEKEEAEWQEAKEETALDEKKGEIAAQENEEEEKTEKPKPTQYPTVSHGIRMSPMQPGKYAAGNPVQQPKVTFTTRLKGAVFGQVKISEKDADPFIETLKIELLQSDVNYDVAEKMAARIRSGLIGKAVDSKNIEGEITEAIRGSIMGVLSSRPDTDILGMIKRRRDVGGLPFKIMFIGPNGAGKTTTMAKIANMLLSNGITCILSASDTFRAAAIEQTVHHAGKLGISVIKGNYGSDPASVAFDAIAHAKAHGIMAVLIDSAGRQETNKSLIEELKKMARVTAPDLKIFVGEAISGNALLEQVKAIDEAVKIDGIILTKLDVDAKGGNTISILSDTTVPILFFGTGEKYEDIIPYDPEFIIDNILQNN